MMKLFDESLFASFIKLLVDFSPLFAPYLREDRPSFAFLELARRILGESATCLRCLFF
jgi:hypothetical protein